MAVPAAAASTLQEQYNAAQAAFDADDMAAARRGFSAVLPKLEASPRMAAQAAVVRARLGSAMLAMGDAEAAGVILARAAAALPRDTPEWQATTLELANALEIGIDLPAAATAYRAFLALPGISDGERTRAQLGLLRTLIFSDPATARSLADTVLASTQAASGKTRNDSIAQVQTLRGRIELNDGKPKEARIWFEKAMASAGGLGTRVNVADIRVRGDLAIAAFLLGDAEGARKYLAYTGVGGLPEQGFELGADMPLPACAPVGALARNDMAIVEFALAEDGRVQGVTTIYANRRGGPEVLFARAVRGWSWRPAVAKKLPPFWRQSVRMELRCVNSPPSTDDDWALDAGSRAWIAEHAPEPMPEALLGEAKALPVLRVELARRTASFGPASPQLLPVLIAIASNLVGTGDEQRAAAQSGYAIAKAVAAPNELQLYFRYLEAVAEDTRRSAKSGPGMRLETLLKAFDAEGNGNTRMAAVIANHLGVLAAYRQQQAPMSLAYQRVLAAPLDVVPNGDPLRQTARLQLASIEANASRLDSARSLLAATGLTADQCSAFPVTPVLAAAGVNESDFPKEALAWRFEGNVRVAFDLDTNGRPVDVRTVTASPPLVFSEATEKIGRGLRFKPIFRDGAAIACADQQKGIRFRVQH